MTWPATTWSSFSWGNVGTSYYNIVSGILRGLGDSFTPLVFLLVACGLNIVLDLYFVAVLGMASQARPGHDHLPDHLGDPLHPAPVADEGHHLHRPQDAAPARVLRPAARAPGPALGITQGIFSLAMSVVQSLTNSMGTAVIACTTVVMRVTDSP